MARMAKRAEKQEDLRFECTECGLCCTRRGKYAHVYLEDAEVDALARFLSLSRRAFLRRFTFVDELGWRQLRFPEQACPFLDQASGRCRVYPARPVQCRTFPFWREMIGPRGWTAEAKSLCEGVGRGRRYSRGEVEALFAQMDEWDGG
ncbi:MAG: YkgJ family cysteine cluster protein [Deltaproteobacteria bacterium]|nr:MAG: YkgJ family cysteine cluster protein [Deltaproteobacteria bacterium]